MSLFPLNVQGAVVRKRGHTLLGPIDLALDGSAGATVVIGPTGSGKTTLLKLLHGLHRPRTGKVTWAKDEPSAQAFVFQQPVLLRRTVRDNIAYPLTLRGMDRTRARQEADAWLERVGLSAAASQSAHDLSGGERQKMALARALITKPEVVFLDESCASLDGRATREIETILQDTNAQIILSTHDMGQARRLAKRVVFLVGGKVRETADAETFFAQPETSEAAAFLRGDIIE